eukprot:CAMPEP_0185763802 /NCGR_PEP_ID=MMETSP1174-20130828/22698_1 /TAXON_ID=35687 /ORGANISM="Dictyocha speculum, Strain CCMP1381" /LENGTH=282 /DNA_ID=CAMNT_0028446041 /DNA_START=93 /DNA_END=941 /DNA_ORIENTATION=+
MYSTKVDAIEQWSRAQTLRTFIPPDEMAAAIRDLRNNEAMWAQVKPNYERLSRRIEDQLRDETRTISELMGESVREKLLDSVNQLDGDPEATRAFFTSPAVESVIGSILYDAIFEFIKTVDILGNIVNSLPVIGPIRQQIMGSLRKELDRTLGRQVKGFLGSYSKLATEQLATLVLSEANAAGFRTATRKIVEQVLERPVNSLLPSPATAEEIRNTAWDMANQPLPLADDEIIERVYSTFGDVKVEDLGIEDVEPIRRLADGVLERFLASEEGKAFLAESRQ